MSRQFPLYALLMAGILSGCASLSVKDVPIAPLSVEAGFENEFESDLEAGTDAPLTSIPQSASQ